MERLRTSLVSFYHTAANTSLRATGTMTSGSKRGPPDDHPRRLHNGRVIPKQRPRNVTEAQATQLADWIFSQEKRPTILETTEWYRSQFRKRLDYDVCGNLIDSIIGENVMAQHQVSPLECRGSHDLATNICLRSSKSWPTVLSNFPDLACH